MLKKFKLIIKGRSFRLPTPTKLPRIKLPRLTGIPTIGMANSKIKYVVFGSVMLSACAVSVGMFFAVRDVMGSTYDWPKPGASYSDLPNGGTLGQELPKYADGSDNQTLAVILEANTRLENLTVDLDMTPPVSNGVYEDCISIVRKANTTGYLYADTFTMDKLMAPSLTMSNSEVHQMTLSGSTDGHHTGPTQSSAIPSIEISSLYGASSYTADGRVDKLEITLNGDAIVKTVNITGRCGGGAVDLDYIKAGQFTLSDIKIGKDGDLSTNDFDIEATTKVYTVNDSLSDLVIIVK